jgi:cell division septation protein DedD
MRRLSMLVATVALLTVSCVAHKGSTSFESSQTSQSSVAQPKVKSNEQLKAQAEAAEAAAREAKERAQEQARQAAQKAQEAADAQKRLAEKTAQEEAEKLRKEAEAKASELADKAGKVNEAVKEAVDKSIVVREESAKVIETKSTSVDGNYHIIIGTFKSLVNARNVSSTAVANGFLPSIMENDEGLYRVSVYTGSEANVRKKLIEIKSKFPEYVGVWIMKLK